MRITLQSFLDDQGKTIKAFSHVGMARHEPHANATWNRDHRRDSAFMTRISAVASTSAPTMMRSPPASTISMRPIKSGETELSGLGMSGTTVTGKIRADSSPPDELFAPNRRRQVNRRLALIPWRLATSAADTPGSRHSERICRLLSSDQTRRRRRLDPTISSLPSDMVIVPTKNLSGHDRPHYRTTSLSRIAPGGSRRRVTESLTSP